jgi:hypothetical protein
MSLNNKFSFPNSDQEIPGVSGRGVNIIPDDQKVTPRKSVVNIIDALNQNQDGDADTEKIRTYQSDIAGAVKNDNVTMIKVALAEKKRQESQGDTQEIFEEKSNAKFLIFASLSILVFLVLAFAAFYIFTSTPPIGPSGSDAVPNQLIFSEERAVINIDNRDAGQIKAFIKNEKEQEFELGSIKNIFLVTGSGTSTRQINTSEFFSFTQSRVNDQLIRSLKDNFMLGIYSGRPYETFAIFKVDFYDGAFAGTLEWEDRLESDIGQIFINKIPETDGSTSSNNASNQSMNIATSSNEESTVIDLNEPIIIDEDERFTTADFFKTNRFIDRVVENKDARVLINDEGDVLMLYSFIDKETLIFTTSEKTLRELIFRIKTGGIVR